jgi:hypothetical protein
MTAIIPNSLRQIFIVTSSIITFRFFSNKEVMTQMVHVKLLYDFIYSVLMELVIKAVKEVRYIVNNLRLNISYRMERNLDFQYLVILIIGWCQWYKKQSNSDESIALKNIT